MRSNLIRLAVLALCLTLLPSLAQAQNIIRNTTLQVGTQTGPVWDLTGTGVTSHAIVWSTLGTVSAGACALQSSVDNTFASPSSLIAAQTVTSSGGPTTTAVGNANFAQMICTTPISGTGSVIVTYIGLNTVTGGTTNVSVGTATIGGNIAFETGGHLAAIDTSMRGGLPAALGTGGGMKIDGSGTALPVSGTVTANAGTNLNTSALAVETGGHLASIDTSTSRDLSSAGAVGGASTLATTFFMGGGEYRSTPLTLTDTKQAELQLDSTGALKVSGAFSTGVAQGSTTSGQTGSLVQCAVTTAAPTYTTGQTNPCSLDTSGQLRITGTVSAGGVAQGSTTAGQTGGLTQATVVVDGSPPTYAAGTTNPLVMNTDGLLRVETFGTNGPGAASAGVFGELALGAVSTSAPSYTNATTNHVSLQTDGSLRSAITNLPSDAADAATVTTNPVPAGCVYTTSPTTLTTGQSGYLYCDNNHALRVDVVSGSTGNAAAGNTGSAVPSQGGYTAGNLAGNLVGIAAYTDAGSNSLGVHITGGAATTVTINTAATGAVTVAGSVTATQTTATNLLTEAQLYTSNGTAVSATNPVATRPSDGSAFITDAAIGAALSSNPIPIACHNETSPTTISNTQAGVPECDTTQHLITVVADGSANKITSNSTTYTAKFGLDGNLLGTLGTAFSTAGKVDVKGADGDVFVRQTTAANLNASVVGIKTNNNAAPAATLIDTMTGLANAAAPSYTEGNSAKQSLTLAGAARQDANSLLGKNLVINPCATNVPVAFSVTTAAVSATVVTAVNGQKVYLCDYGFNTADAAGSFVSVVAGTGTTCGTVVDTFRGSAANTPTDGWFVAASGGGAVFEGGGVPAAWGSTNGDDLCLFTGGKKTQFSGHYVHQGLFDPFDWRFWISACALGLYRRRRRVIS